MRWVRDSKCSPGGVVTSEMTRTDTEVRTFAADVGDSSVRTALILISARNVLVMWKGYTIRVMNLIVLQPKK